MTAKRWIEVTRFPPIDNNGYTVWVRVLEMTEDGSDYDEIDENIFGSKKAAYSYCRRLYPGFPIRYTTEIKRNHSFRGD